MKRRLATAIVAFVLALSSAMALADSRTEWAVRPGISLEVFATDFVLPVMIAIVPEPGPEPEDPFLFVTELAGTIRVVTNDGSVHDFAKDFFELEMPVDLPKAAGAMGLTGITLDPATGYIFATFAYQAKSKRRYNNIIRFETKPHTFSLKPTGSMMFTDALRSGRSNFTRNPNGHQIGACLVDGDKLYVGVGDGEMSRRSRNKRSLFGKVLCLTLDGKPHPENPFHDDKGAASLIHTLGLRNPFGMVEIDGRIFVGDNGPGVDRIVEAHKGMDYLYDGSDASIGLNALAVLSPARGMGQMGYLERNTSFAPAGLGEGFLLARTGPPEILIEGEYPAVTWLGFDPDRTRVTTPERTVVEYIGTDQQCLNALAVGKDEIFFAPLFSDGKPGPVSIYRMRYDPKNPAPEILGAPRTGLAVIKQRRCLGCHSFRGRGGKRAPALDPKDLIPRLHARIGTAEYTQKLASWSPDDDGFRDARKSVLAADGDERIRRWITEHVMEPRFDSKNATMPALGVNRREAEMLAAYLLEAYHSSAIVEPE
ncbi:MAG: PQQ-dependent sugar dehydrogenase [Myxococcales bacterium]|nr:PQQ-dependent sugar dehydrogenase [Myxococcales bacterium]